MSMTGTFCVRVTHASGQYFQQIRQPVHFEASMTGRSVLHVPVRFSDIDRVDTMTRGNERGSPSSRGMSPLVSEGIGLARGLDVRLGFGRDGVAHGEQQRLKIAELEDRRGGAAHGRIDHRA